MMWVLSSTAQKIHLKAFSFFLFRSPAKTLFVAHAHWSQMDLFCLNSHKSDRPSRGRFKSLQSFWPDAPLHETLQTFKFDLIVNDVTKYKNVMDQGKIRRQQSLDSWTIMAHECVWEGSSSILANSNFSSQPHPVIAIISPVQLLCRVALPKPTALYEGLHRLQLAASRDSGAALLAGRPQLRVVGAGAGADAGLSHRAHSHRGGVAAEGKHPGDAGWEPQPCIGSSQQLGCLW